MKVFVAGATGAIGKQLATVRVPSRNNTRVR